MVPPPLRCALAALADVLVAAREELTAEECSWRVAIGCEALGTEAASPFAGEFLRASRREEDTA